MSHDCFTWSAPMWAPCRGELRVSCGRRPGPRGCQPLAAQTSSRQVRSSCGSRSGSASAALPRMTFVDIAPADQTAVDAMWASYVADSGYDGPLVTAFASGDSAELAGELGLL